MPRRHRRPSAIVRGMLKTALFQSRRKTLHKMQRGLCAYCRQPVELEDATLDHRHPLARGGSSDMENLVMACEGCNTEKGHKTEAEFRSRGLEIRRTTDG